MNSWIERYASGQHRQVWTEMTSLGAAIVEDPQAILQAEAVGRETMRRARRNVELLVTRLPRAGYSFAPGEGLNTFEGPPADVKDRLDEIEALVGPLPNSFRWWSEEVGVVNLMGACEQIPAYADPLVVEAPTDYLLGQAHVWRKDQGTEWDQGDFEVGFSPDYLHKANVSGGAPYSLRTPANGVDGLVLWNRLNTTFVNYLRIAFSNAGFLGWSAGTCHEPLPQWLTEIAQELEPL